MKSRKMLNDFKSIMTFLIVVSKVTIMNFSRAWHITYPIFLGYMSVGFVFGMMTVSTGLPWFYALSSSVFLYAGASQFLLVSSVKAGLPLLDIFISVFLLNLRHVFYFKPIAHKIESKGIKRLYSILTITDESFALIADDHVTRGDSFLVLVFSQSFWVIGTLFGAISGGLLAKAKWAGLDFSLVALFTVLFIEKLRFKKDKIPLVFCLGICLLIWFSIPQNLFLIGSIAVCLFFTAAYERKKNGG